MYSLDKKVTKLIHRSIRTGGSLEYFIAVFASCFNNEVASFVWLLAFCSRPWSGKLFIFCLAMPVATLLISLLFKNTLRRTRPKPYGPRKEALLFDFRGKETNPSLPSGDSAQAAAFWIFMYLEGCSGLGLSVIFTLLTMYARVYYMCHYVLDTIVGAALGATMCYFMRDLILS